MTSKKSVKNNLNVALIQFIVWGVISLQYAPALLLHL